MRRSAPGLSGRLETSRRRSDPVSATTQRSVRLLHDHSANYYDHSSPEHDLSGRPCRPVSQARPFQIGWIWVGQVCILTTRRLAEKRTTGCLAGLYGLEI